MPTLSLVCLSASSWILPALYHSVTLSTATQISSFYYGLAYGQRSDRLGPSPLTQVRKLWIGATSRTENDLTYASSSWPITIIHQLLTLCTQLHSLTVIDLEQGALYRLEGTLPSTLQTLKLGPVHGPVVVKNFTRSPRLRHFSSIDTFMRDSEIQDIVLSPHIRTVRRIFHVPSFGIQFAFEQLPCVSRSETLEQMQMVFYKSDDERYSFQREIEFQEMYSKDHPDSCVKFVYLTIPRSDWVKMLYDEFIEDTPC